jgi:ABC-type sugar transport system ATPase subunit
MADPEYIVEMKHITKRFPGIVANDDVSIQVRKGEIYALLGENGAGKSTLMSMLFGMYQPDEGEILGPRKEREHRIRPVMRQNSISVWCISILSWSQTIRSRKTSFMGMEPETQGCSAASL